MDPLQRQLAPIAAQFQCAGRLVEVLPLGAGHINDTYLLAYDGCPGRRYCVLQRINHDVFKDPERLMENLVRVTTHLQHRRKEEGAGMVVQPFMTHAGRHWHRDERGSTWRLLNAIDHAHTIDGVPSARQIYQASKAFGAFLRLLDDLPGPPLHETIPGFHDGPQRYEVLPTLVAGDPCARVARARPEIQFVTEQRDILFRPDRLRRQGVLPIRVTHNDTKINNVLLHEETDESLCVIDLDTVMPGLALYDVGDIVRTAVSAVAEDERDLSLVQVDLGRFENIVSGFLQGAGDALTKAEQASLVLGGQYMTLIIGMRFLIDFLQGDTYFKTDRVGHNLDRCRTQFRLVQLLMDQEEQMQQIVRRWATEL